MVDPRDWYYRGVRDWWLRQCHIPEPDRSPHFERAGELLRREWDGTAMEDEFIAMWRDIDPTPTKPPPDANWPRQADVARALGVNRMAINRLVQSGELETNGRTGHECRIDPASVLAYCDRHRIAYDGET